MPPTYNKELPVLFIHHVVLANRVFYGWNLKEMFVQVSEICRTVILVILKNRASKKRSEYSYP